MKEMNQKQLNKLVFERPPKYDAQTKGKFFN